MIVKIFPATLTLPIALESNPDQQASCPDEVPVIMLPFARISNVLIELTVIARTIVLLFKAKIRKPVET